MIKLFLKFNSEPINISKNTMFVQAEEQDIFKQIAFNFYETISVVNDNEYIKLENNSTIIYNPFQLSINDKIDWREVNIFLNIFWKYIYLLLINTKNPHFMDFFKKEDK